VIVLVNKYLLANGFRAMSLWPFVILKDKALAKDCVFMNHERIHLYQQTELLVLPFYLWYFLEFLLRWYQYKKPYLAYKNISFEREAYANESDLNYFRKRHLWNFINYLVKIKTEKCD
jgi:hypothetical protein